MNSSASPNEIARKIRRLTLAVWVLAALLAVNFAYDAFSPAIRIDRPRATETDTAPRNPWEGLSIEEKLKRSSAVLLTKNVRSGNRQRTVVQEILKQSPDTTMFYKVGEEMRSLSMDGDGALVLLTGSPASMQESYSIRGGYIRGLGDMPVTKVKEILGAAE